MSERHTSTLVHYADLLKSGMSSAAIVSNKAYAGRLHILTTPEAAGMERPGNTLHSIAITGAHQACNRRMQRSIHATWHTRLARRLVFEAAVDDTVQLGLTQFSAACYFQQPSRIGSLCPSCLIRHDKRPARSRATRRGTKRAGHWWICQLATPPNCL
jgi:hypothetical protein